MAHRVFIGIGSNLGDRKGNYQEALERIAKLPRTRVVKASSLYESEPHGDAKTWYVNGVAEIETEFTAEQLLRRLKAIEQAMGRSRKAQRKKWASRPIDLDILFFDHQIVETRSVSIPHPELHKRRFVLLPLSELAPNFVHPRLGVTVSGLLAAVKNDKRVMLMPP
jgi:2-amino-4-hydroxy-6-hydroxymethyldihydropteridine diphosphokinase